jgi:hypothetical protein
MDLSNLSHGHDNTAVGNQVKCCKIRICFDCRKENLNKKIQYGSMLILMHDEPCYLCKEEKTTIPAILWNDED